MEIPGSYFGGVYYGEEILLRVNFDGYRNFQKKVPLEIRDTVAVIGSGNMALDCARTYVRLGRKVSLVFEGTEEDLAVYGEDYKAAKDEGVNFLGLTRV
jgi:glutamate synthase (NADPH/NADH) small chain